MSKVCNKCGVEKSVDEFSFKNKKRGYLQSICKDCAKEDSRINRAKKGDEINKRRRELRKVLKIGEHKRDIARAYYRANKDKIMQNISIYAKNNKDKINTRRKDHYHRVKKYDPIYVLKKNIRTRTLLALKNETKFLSMKDYLGCDVEFLREYLESKFVDGMSWDNYGKGGWHVDHIKPLASFNLCDKNEQIKAFHYSNLQPLWEIDNLKKGIKYEQDY